MMKKQLIIPVLLLVVGCSLQNENYPDRTINLPQTITADYANNDQVTKMTMADSGAFVRYFWKEGDRIAFLSAGEEPIIYTLFEGAGTQYASFKYTSGTFADNKWYVVCHYGTDITISNDVFCNNSKAQLFEEQDYSSFEDQAIYIGMFNGTQESFKATEQASIPTEYKFRTAFSLLKVNVTNSKSESIVPKSVAVTATTEGNAYFVKGFSLKEENDSMTISPTDGINAMALDLSGQKAIPAGESCSYMLFCMQNPTAGTLSKLDFTFTYQ